ncbi:hypothetical protein [Aldersonia kunmingensis]|nr:hypothetical protein [Aldersonia kunmingensis]
MATVSGRLAWGNSVASPLATGVVDFGAHGAGGDDMWTQAFRSA